MENIWQTLVQINDLFLLAILTGIPVGSTIWAYRDAAARKKPAVLVAMMVLVLVWPIGLVLWLIIRPEKTGLQQAGS